MKELKELQRESKKLRDKEISENYRQLSEESQIKLVMFSRELLEKEKEQERFERFMELFRKLDDKDKPGVVAYVEALTKDPRYRKART